LQTDANLFLSKTGLLGLKMFRIKYGCERFEVRNNFPYRNFLRFEMDFKRKFREDSRLRFEMDFK
jgi:hypothetical protein